MISVYSLLTPPKTGNCKILEPNIHTITINDLNFVMNNKDISQRSEKIETLKKKLDFLLMSEVEVDDIFDSNIHNYYKAEVENCVLYYICGYITKNIVRKIECNNCLTVLTGMHIKHLVLKLFPYI